MDNNVEKDWQEFWKDIVCDKNGNIDIDDVGKYNLDEESE